MKKWFWSFLAGLCGVLVMSIIIWVDGGSESFVQYKWWWLCAGFVGGVAIWLIHIREYFTEIDIGSRNKWPANVLSNFHDNPFYFDGIYCASIEGLLQAFKTKYANEQIRLCGLPGPEAQEAGREYNDWKDSQYLHWNGKSYERGSVEYWELLLRVFDIENMSSDKIAGLLATGNRKLVHSIGKNDKTQTILTEDEFCRLLTIARAKLKEKGLAYIG